MVTGHVVDSWSKIVSTSSRDCLWTSVNLFSLTLTLDLLPHLHHLIPPVLSLPSPEAVTCDSLSLWTRHV